MRSDWYQNLIQHPRLLPASGRSASGGAQILSVLEQYRLTERLEPAELESQQRALLAAVASHCAVNSEPFAQRLSAAGLTAKTLAEPGGLSRLAPLQRKDLADAKSNPEFFCGSTPMEHGRVGTSSTSGSTGEPVTLRRTELCDLHWAAHTLREHLWHERDFSAPLAVIRANATEVRKSSSWGAPSDRVLQTGPALVMPASLPLEEIFAHLSEFKPEYLLVLPAVLAGLLDLSEQAGRRLTGLRGIRTLSETVSPELRAKAERLTGLRIDDVYSSQEGGVMAMQCPEQGAYHVAETVLLEVVDNEGRPCVPGQVGRILLTDLINFATPVIRYEIGDYAEAGELCVCGRGLPAIRRFLGRERNLLLLPDGSRRWPVVGFHFWGEIWPIRQFQFCQLDRHTIEAKFWADASPPAEREERLTEVIRRALGYPFEIRYEWRKAPLARGPGGKFEEFVCKAT